MAEGNQCIEGWKTEDGSESVGRPFMSKEEDSVVVEEKEDGG